MKNLNSFILIITKDLLRNNQDWSINKPKHTKRNKKKEQMRRPTCWSELVEDGSCSLSRWRKDI